MLLRYCLDAGLGLPISWGTRRCILARSLMSASVKFKMSVCRGDFTSILIPSGFALQKRLAESTLNVCQPRLSNELDMVAYLEKKSQKIGCLLSLRALMRDALAVSSAYF